MFSSFIFFINLSNPFSPTLSVSNKSFAFSISMVLLNAASNTLSANTPLSAGLSLSMSNILFISDVFISALDLISFTNPIIVFISSDCISAFSFSDLLKSSILDFCTSDITTGKLCDLLFINSYIPTPAYNIGSLFSSKRFNFCSS